VFLAKSSPIWYSYGLKLGLLSQGFTYQLQSSERGMFSAKKSCIDNTKLKLIGKNIQNHITSLKEGEEPSLQIPDQ